MRGIDPLLRRPGERGTLAICEHECDLATQGAPRRDGHEGSKVAAGAGDADGDATRHERQAAAAWSEPST